MKHNLGILFITCAVVVSGLAFSQDPPPSPTPAADGTKIERLERDLLDSRTRVEALAVEVAGTKAVLTYVIAYLESQAQSAEALATTLDASEEAGFTYGINPESRHILLRGWREHLATLQKNVPAQIATAPAAKTDGKTAKQANGG